MSSHVLAPDGMLEAHCDDCDWTYERSLEAGDDLSIEDNQEIAERVVRNHEYTCKATGDGWGETATVAFDGVGGDS
ncbi:hypothetical protein [Natrinema pallidum]|uniref:Uncharacterized protein n=1 Tax=Natrinema pallidum TaxID=69527 RepID=A0A4V1IFK0_9EURY|nr:hypothetical protein [Natrinema pallidum]QCW05264.1 hypothetical protein FGF80_18640 [Natrinema pallidum]